MWQFSLLFLVVVGTHSNLGSDEKVGRPSSCSYLDLDAPHGMVNLLQRAAAAKGSLQRAPQRAKGHIAANTSSTASDLEARSASLINRSDDSRSSSATSSISRDLEEAKSASLAEKSHQTRSSGSKSQGRRKRTTPSVQLPSAKEARRQWKAGLKSASLIEKSQRSGSVHATSRVHLFLDEAARVAKTQVAGVPGYVVFLPIVGFIFAILAIVATVVLEFKDPVLTENLRRSLMNTREAVSKGMMQRGSSDSRVPQHSASRHSGPGAAAATMLPQPSQGKYLAQSGFGLTQAGMAPQQPLAANAMSDQLPHHSGHVVEVTLSELVDGEPLGMTIDRQSLEIKEAPTYFNFHVGDKVQQVNDTPVQDELDFKQALDEAIETKKRSARPVVFRVLRILGSRSRAEAFGLQTPPAQASQSATLGAVPQDMMTSRDVLGVPAETLPTQELNQQSVATFAACNVSPIVQPYATIAQPSLPPPSLPLVSAHQGMTPIEQQPQVFQTIAPTGQTYQVAASGLQQTQVFQTMPALTQTRVAIPSQQEQRPEAFQVIASEPRTAAPLPQVLQTQTAHTFGTIWQTQDGSYRHLEQTSPAHASANQRSLCADDHASGNPSVPQTYIADHQTLPQSPSQVGFATTYQAPEQVHAIVYSPRGEARFGNEAAIAKEVTFGHDDVSQVLGTWTYGGGENEKYVYKITAAQDGRIRFEQQNDSDASSLSGLLTKDGPWYVGELKSSESEVQGQLRFRLLKDGQATSQFWPKDTTSWLEEIMAEKEQV